MRPKTSLRTHVTLGAGHGLERRRAFLDFGESAAQAGGQILAHAEHGVRRAHHHAAHRDGTDDVAPHGAGLRGPIAIGGIGGHEGLQLRS